MMPEISLNILDVAQNSVTAGSTLVTISVTADSRKDLMTVAISDNGRGMTAEQVLHVTDPFFTTRTTRKVGLGVPFFKMAAEMAGGDFSIESTPGVGTTTQASFRIGHIDRMPLGDLAGTMSSLVGPSPEIDFILRVEMDGEVFEMDTRQFREVLGEGVSLSEPEVLAYLEEYVREGMAQVGADRL